MKKAVSLLLALVLCLGLCACSNAESTSQFVGTYEDKYEITEYYKLYIYDNLVHHISCKKVLTLNDGGTGTFKTTATSAGEHYQVGDIVEEGTVTWMAEGDYITITYKGFRYKKDYGNNTTELIDHTSTYEKKAGTLHTTASGILAYTKIG